MRYEPFSILIWLVVFIVVIVVLLKVLAYL